MPSDNTAKAPSASGPFADVAPALDRINTNELPFHLNFALQNGVTKDELAELITHLAFYAGWPPASTAVGIVRKVFAETAK